MMGRNCRAVILTLSEVKEKVTFEDKVVLESLLIKDVLFKLIN